MSETEPAGPELVIQHTGQVFPLTQESVTIGAADDNDIILADPEVAAHQATIDWDAASNSYAIQDMGSASGTFINERRVEDSQPLRHGDVLRVGNTIIDFRLGEVPPEQLLPPIDEEQPGSLSKSPVLVGILALLLAGLILACCVLVATVLLTGGGGAVEVVIQSPPADSQIAIGSNIMLQATASNARDITLLEMSIDGSLVATATSANPKGQSSLTLTQPWTFAVPGELTISAVARTASGKTSRTERIKVTVVGVQGGVPPTTTPTPAPLEATPAPTPLPSDVPTDIPEVTATPTPTPRPSETAPLPPQIEYFQASPASITAGGCTTLQWGKVNGATEARIDPDVGGVGTPGTATACPLETTTYILTAVGPGGKSQASTIVTVQGALPDLSVDSITFDPNPAFAGEPNEVKITIQNIGAGRAGAFDWEWQAGTDARFDGRLRGLEPGEATIVTVRWTPSAAYDPLDTVALVDTRDEIPESDKGNNEFWATVQVLESETEQPETLTLQSERALDGFQANDGSGSNKGEILVGNGQLTSPTGELVWRGFMSFDLSSLPTDATIEAVELRFFQAVIEGSPYLKLGNLGLDLVDYGSRLDATAFDTPALQSAVLAQQPSPGNWYIFASPLFDEWLEQTLAAGRTRFQLRLKFQPETDADGLQDSIGIESGRNSYRTGNVPLLIVTFSQ